MPPVDRINRALAQHGYVQIKKVGSGSFGQAILVKQTGKEDTGERYICKMIDISRATAKEKTDALREAEVLKTLKHPYIVRYRESFIEDGWLCIVMDYCDGGDLHQKIKDAKARCSPISEEQVLRWMTQATLALKYIHEKHILHRDLKSSNFFLSKNGNLKLGDFGIAKVLDSTAACARTQIGTPYYLSPEICSEKPYTWPSDIWAMGCILYEMTALKVPFDANDLKGLIQRITRGPTPSLPPGRYSPPLRELCSELLQRDTRRRPSAAEILRKPIIQDTVRRLLGEANANEEERDAAAAAAAAPGSAAAPARPEAIAAAASPQGPWKALYAANAGCYTKGDTVEYYSETHKEWLPSIVNSVDEEGRIILNVKPNTKLSLELQAERVRPRRAFSKEQPGPSAAGHLAPNVPPWAPRGPGQPRSSSRPNSPSPRGLPRSGSQTPRSALYTPRCAGSPRGRFPGFPGSQPGTPTRQPSPGGGGGALVRCPSLPGSRGGSPMGFPRAPSPMGRAASPIYRGHCGPSAYQPDTPAGRAGSRPPLVPPVR